MIEKLGVKKLGAKDERKVGSEKNRCSYGEQIRDVKHKRYLTSIHNLLSRLTSGWHIYLLVSRLGPVWTREGLPAEKTSMLKSAKNSQKVKSRD